jgi:chaperonin cofactor prefoldin
MNEVLLQNYIPSLATIIVVGIGILFNNARIGDLNTNFNKRIDDLRADTFARFERLESQQVRLEGQYSRLESILIGKLDEVDARLNRIESHLGLH